MNPNVSVIIPYYNNELHISETLESIYAQTFAPAEVIVTDDGSVQRSADFLDTLSEKYKDLIIIHKENEGPSATRNTGAARATGNYLLFVDADDIIDNTFIEKTVQVMLADPAVKLVYTKGENFGAKTGEWVLPEYSLHRILFENCIPVTALMYRSDFEKAGGFDRHLNFFEDWDLWLTLIKNGGKVYRIDEILFFYRRREESNSLSDHIKGNKERISDNFFKIYSKHYVFYKQHNIYFIDFFQAAADNFRFRKKYYNIFYKKFFYRIKGIFKSPKHTEVSEFQKIMEKLNF